MEKKTYKKWISEVFDRSAKTYGEKYNAYFDYFGKKLVELAKLSKAAHVLDVATGSGVIAKEVAKSNGPLGRVVGIDISPNMIKKAAEEIKGYPTIELSCMDAENLDFKDDTFDYVFCGFGIFFFPDISKALSEFFRVLKPGGKLLVSTWGESDELLSRIFYDVYNSFGFDTKLVWHNFKDPVLVKNALSEVHFSNIEIIKDELINVYPSIKDWLDAFWGHAVRGLLERLTPDQLVSFEKELTKKLLPHLKPDGLHSVLRVNYIVANKQK